MIDQHGSFVAEGPLFSVLQCRGPVRYRQDLASRRRVICYAEAHLNAFTNPATQYGFVVTGSSVPEQTHAWANAFLERVREKFNVPNRGILRGVPGAGCVQWVRWPTPTMLLEPGFMSHPPFAAKLQTGEGQDALGQCLAESIRACFPQGGLVGLSIGHAYRGNNDPGAHVEPSDFDGDGVLDWEHDPKFDDEAELAEAYVTAATEYLTSYEKP